MAAERVRHFPKMEYSFSSSHTGELQQSHTKKGEKRGWGTFNRSSFIKKRKPNSTGLLCGFVWNLQVCAGGKGCTFFSVENRVFSF